ncbi:hypothetical protein ABIE52_000025 [Rhodococcus sp. OAS809]
MDWDSRILQSCGTGAVGYGEIGIDPGSVAPSVSRYNSTVSRRNSMGNDFGVAASFHREERSSQVKMSTKLGAVLAELRAPLTTEFFTVPRLVV